MGLSIVIPTLNEEDNIGLLVSRIKSLNPSAEILVCDNGSSDTTVFEAHSHGAIVLEGLGLVGDAVLRGIRAAYWDKIVVMDADFSHPPETLLSMEKALQEHDFVVASRYTSDLYHEVDHPIRAESRDTLKNRIISHVGNAIVWTLAPSMSDRMSGFWGARKSVLDHGLQNGVRPTAKLMLEFYIKGKPSSYAEVGFVFNPRANGVSKIGRSWSLVRSTTDALRLNFIKYDKITKFLTVSGIGIGVNLGTLLFLTEIMGFWYFMSAIVAVGAAVTWNFTMHSMWTFGKCGNLFDFWNLGHDVSDGDFEWWEYYGPHPVKRWWKRRVAQITRDLVSKYPLEDLRILVLGCGSSPSINLYHCQRVGIDISKEKIDFLSRHTDAVLLQADITRPIALIDHGKVSKQYDIIICNEVMEHLDSQALVGVVSNIDNLLSPKGKVVISIPDESTSRIGRLAERIMHKDIHTPITMATVAEHMRSHGLIETGRDHHLWVQVARFARRPVHIT